jgi:hypothetical protein
MDAVEYLKTLDRMCNAECRKCEFREVHRVNGGCSTWQKNHPEEAVAIVEQWAAEHPIKTRQSEFLKMFPGADVGETDSCLTLCPCNIYGKMRKECGTPKCSECRRKFWLAEVEE